MEVKVTIQSKALSKEEVRLLIQSIRDCELKSFPDKEISIEVIEKKLVGKQVVIDVGTVVTPQRYDVKCKMRMSIRWYPEGGAPIKLPVEKVQINESRGFLQDRGDHNALWWDWFPEQGKPAMFEMVLAAGKGISKEELVKVAESVRY